MTISRAAASTIAVEARRSADGKETGGILLGHDMDGRLRVVAAGDPGPTAQRSKDRFLRDLKHARELADAAYDSDGSVWIGEWHTHPSGPAIPSDLDLSTYAKHLADETLGFDRFLSLIALPCPEHHWEHPSVVAWIIMPGVAAAAEVELDG